MLPDLAGWIPAAVFPGASLLQLVKLLKSRSVEGVSLATWLLFVLANIGMYIFTEKYFVIQSIVTNLVTASIQGTIVVLILVRRRE